MKKAASYLILLLTVGLCGACSDVLDIDPTDRYSPASVWSDKDAVDKYVFGFYGMLKEKDGVYNAGFFSDAFSDIMKSSSWDQYNHSYNYVLLQDTYFTSDDARTFSCWGDTYNRIFRLNIFLRDAPGYVSSFGQEFITTRMAEVRFFRGYCYYLLTRVYGGVVLRKAVDGPADNDKPRSTEAESWQQVIDDITYAAENLPESWDGANSGRITKAAAYGMLSRVALYAKQWNLAVEAADLCKQYANDPLSTSYSDIFNNSANPENLLVLNFLPGYMESGITHDHDTYFRPVGDSPYHNKVSIKSAFGPTSELVDSYEMADGSEFSWESHGDDPYANREPRFYATVLYNGAKWEGRTIETFVGGADGLIEFQTSGAANASTTGYYFRKFLTEGERRGRRRARRTSPSSCATARCCSTRPRRWPRSTGTRTRPRRSPRSTASAAASDCPHARRPARRSSWSCCATNAWSSWPARDSATGTCGAGGWPSRSSTARRPTA